MPHFAFSLDENQNFLNVPLVEHIEDVNVQLGRRSVGDPVRGPTPAPWPNVHWVVGEQVRVRSSSTPTEASVAAISSK